MRKFLSVLLVGLLATTASAQFSKKGSLPPAGKATDTPQRKLDKANPDQAGKAADQAGEPDFVGALLAAMDMDRDGIVTKIEMNKAMAAIRKVHKDPKGNMVVPEKAADADAPVAGLDPTQAVPGAGAQQPVAGGRGNEAMARFTQFDRNGDGRLTSDEVTVQDRAMLQGADLNNDNAIDARELQMFSRKMGDRMRAWAAGVDPKNGAGVPGDGRRPPR